MGHTSLPAKDAADIMSFDDYVAAHLEKPFKWGENDCVTFAVGWVNIRTGKDWLAELPKWNSAMQAHKLIHRLGGLEYLIDKALPRIHANYSKDGDITLGDNTVYLVAGEHIIGPGFDGLIFLDRTLIKCAWSYY